MPAPLHSFHVRDRSCSGSFREFGILSVFVQELGLVRPLELSFQGFLRCQQHQLDHLLCQSAGSLFVVTTAQINPKRSKNTNWINAKVLKETRVFSS